MKDAAILALFLVLGFLGIVLFLGFQRLWELLS